MHQKRKIRFITVLYCKLIYWLFKMLGKKSPQNGRENADDVILLFTDGKPNAENTTQEIIDADKYSKILKNEKNVKIIGVAAGDISLYRKKIQGWADSFRHGL